MRILKIKNFIVNQNKMTDKWQEAQKNELAVWRRFENKHPYSSSKYLQKRAAILYEWIKFFTNLDESANVLEIGGAGMPIVDYLPHCHRYGTDPMAHHYHKIFLKSLDNDTNYFSSMAENMPIIDGSFDAVIILNVLDHCLNPDNVIDEIYRILKLGGIVVLSVDTYRQVINAARKVRIYLGKIRRNDLLHPHHFCSQKMLKLLNSKFHPLCIHESILDPLSFWKKGYPMKQGFMAKIRNEKRLYYIGKKIKQKTLKQQ